MNAQQLASSITIPQTVCLYGAPKTGKTYAAGQLANQFPLLWFDCENGIQTLFTHLPAEALARITVVRCLEDGAAVADAATALVSGRPVQVCTQHALVKCKECKETVPIQIDRTSPDTIVVIDSMTQVRESMLMKVLGTRPLGSKLEFDDWENLRQQSLNFMLRIQRFPRGLVLITHEQELEHESGILRLTPIAGSRNFALQVARYFGTVVYASVVNRKFTLCVSPEDTKFQAGSRMLPSSVKSLESLLGLFNPGKHPSHPQQGASK